MTQFLRAYCDRTKVIVGGNEPIKFVASTEGDKRDGQDLKADHWDLENYSKNPVFLWVHDYRGNHLPIGRAKPSINTEGKQLIAEVTFDQSDEFAKQVEGKYRRGYLNAVSVGWENYAVCPNCKKHISGWELYYSKRIRLECPACGEEIPAELETWYELLDISGVPVPGDPDALIEREFRALKELMKDRDYQPTQGRPYPNEHACRLREPGDFQDGSFRREEREHEGKKYAVIMGKLKGEDKMTEQAYRYPKDTWSVEAARKHCKDHDGKLFEPAAEKESQGEHSSPVKSEVDVWGGIASAMLALFRHAAAMEEEDHRSVYILLERLYRKLDKVAPEYLSQRELLTLECEEIDGLFLEGEVEMVGPGQSQGIAPTEEVNETEGIGDERIAASLEEIKLRLKLFGG